MPLSNWSELEDRRETGEKHRLEHPTMYTSSKWQSLRESLPMICNFLNYCHLDAFPMIQYISKGALMVFAFPYSLITAVCHSWNARFEAWPALPWLVPLCRWVVVPLSNEPCWAHPPHSESMQSPGIISTHPTSSPSPTTAQVHCSVPNHASHCSRKAFLHGTGGLPHKPPRVSLRWLNLLP